MTIIVKSTDDQTVIVSVSKSTPIALSQEQAVSFDAPGTMERVLSDINDDRACKQDKGSPEERCMERIVQSRQINRSTVNYHWNGGFTGRFGRHGAPKPEPQQPARRETCGSANASEASTIRQFILIRETPGHRLKNTPISRVEERGMPAHT